MIPLGSGAVPTDSDELSARIDAGIRRSLSLAPTSPLTVAARFSSATELELTVDATGASVVAPPGAGPRELNPIGSVLVRQLRLVAKPLHVLGVPVTLVTELNDASGNWSEAADGDLWITAGEAPAERPTTGNVTATVAVADIERYARQQLQALLEQRGLQLKSFTLDIAEHGANGLRALSNATVGKSFLSAKVTTTATATFDDQLAVHLSEVSLSSPNAMVGALISQWSAPLEAWNGRTINLADFALAGMRAQSVRVTADDDAVTISAAVGSGGAAG